MIVVANVDQALLFKYRGDYKAYFYSETAIIGAAVGLIDAPVSGMISQVFFLRKASSVGTSACNSFQADHFLGQLHNRNAILRNLVVALIIAEFLLGTSLLVLTQVTWPRHLDVTAIDIPVAIRIFKQYQNRLFPFEIGFAFLSLLTDSYITLSILTGLRREMPGKWSLTRVRLKAETLSQEQRHRLPSSSESCSS